MMRNTVKILANDPGFKKQAKAFAKWYALERRAVYELGKIAAAWLEHYSRVRNAERLADALFAVTGLRVTGRTIQNYRDGFLLDQSWRSCERKKRVKSRNDFEIRHVGPGHLRVIAGGKLPIHKKLDLLDRVERKRLTVKQTVANVRFAEVDHNRSKRAVHLRPGDPRVIRVDAIDAAQRLPFGSIHHCFLDWQWANNGVWKESYKAVPVHRPDDPVDHLCRLLKALYPHLNKNCIVWIFSKSTAFNGGQIGLPWDVQQTAHDIGLQYASEFIAVHSIAGRRSKNSFLAVKHAPIHPFTPKGFDHAPVRFATSVSEPLTSPNHISQLRVGEERHPYQKPVALFEQLLSMGTPHGQVFDAFAGSGAAGIAAMNCACPYIGAELQPHYARMANRAIALAIANQTESRNTA